MAITLPRPRRRTVGALLTLLLTALFLGGTAGAAQAADGYRYWGYFHVKDGGFAFASTGPAGYTPKDGSTEAYRFGTSTPKQGVQPRADLEKLDFGTVCADTKAASGKKRVAVLIDYGTAADASGAEVPKPRAACAQVAADANGQQVLAAVTKIRSSKDLVCALDGYPASGCGDAVKDVTVPTNEAPVAFALPGSDPSGTGDSGSGNNGLLIGGAVVLVVVLGGGAVLLSRRSAAA
jgi:hypothetical protein